MSRGVNADRARLSVFVLRRGLRAFAARVNTSPLLRWRFSAGSTDRLVISPQDLRTADPTRASEIYAGRFAFAGKVVLATRRSPFAVLPPSTEWAERMADFGWLRHLRAADSSLARSNARSLVSDWISLQRTWNTIAWRPDVVARRVIAWLMHAPFLLQDADPRFYRRFLRSLSRQVRFLNRTAGNLGDGETRLQCLAALNYAALCMSGQARLAKPASRRLAEELQRQILPDGGHVSRNPNVLIELLLDLLPLRQAYGAHNIPPPAALNNAIDRMMPMLRFFRHGDGTFANFNGMGPTAPDLLATVLAYDDALGRPVKNAAQSGYQRLENAGLVLLVDTGTPPPIATSEEAHAGCLSFELSTRRHRIIVNSGLPETSRDSWRHHARTTPAHSTLSIAGTSSCRFMVSERFNRLVGAPIIAGPAVVNSSRSEDEAGITLSATHDGYAQQFGIIHQRILTLSADGRRLDGEDALLPARGLQLPRSERFAVRFHLHPNVRANRLTHRQGVMLTLPNRDVWTFEAYANPVEIEESVYLAGIDGPRRTSQIVLHGETRNTQRLAWSLVLVDPAENAVVRSTTPEPELPL